MSEEKSEKRIEGFPLGKHYMVGEVVDEGAQFFFVTDKRLSSKKRRSVDSIHIDKNRLFIIFRETVTEEYLAGFLKAHDMVLSERLSFTAGVIVKANKDLFETMNEILGGRQVERCEPIEIQKIGPRQ